MNDTRRIPPPRCLRGKPRLGSKASIRLTAPSQRFIYVEDKSFTSHELNFSSTDDGPVQWIAGLYYYSEDFRQEAHFNAVNLPQINAPANGPANPSGDFVFAGSDMTTESMAVFGQVDWQVTETVRLTGGLRYTHDEKEGTEQFRIICLGCAPGTSPDQLGILTPGIDITGAFVSTAPAPGVTTPLTFDPITGRAVRGLKDSWEAVTGTAGIEWKPDADTLVYARYSRGYKSGGFNAGGISVLPRTDPEHVDAFEAGFKTAWGRTLQINTAAYYYNYTDLQVPLTVVIPGGAQLTEFFNIAESSSYGLEIEAAWRPLDNLQLLASYAFAGSEIQEACCFVDGADPLAQQPGAQPVGPLVGGQQPQSLTGQELPQQTPHKVALSAIYTFDLEGGSLDLAANYTWRDETYHSVFNRTYTQTPAFDRVDLRAVWTSADDAYRVIGYVKNVFDEVGYDSAEGTQYDPTFSPGLAVSQTYGLMPPRTFGVQVQLRFN
ncbi:MAG: TonB-dependent receptor [Micropepsaceae bacterium]